MKTKATKRVLSLILTVLMIVPLVATIGCGKKEASVSDIAQVNNAAEVNDAVDETTAETKAEPEAEKADLSDAKAEGETTEPEQPTSIDKIDNTYVIVYDAGSVYARYCAEAIKAKLGDNVGAVVSDETQEQDNEILVGKTNRQASEDVRADYDRPNIYFDIEQVGTKLVVMAEGYLTLQYVQKAFEKINSFENLSGNLASGDVSAAVDNLGTKSMLDRDEDTDLRVFNWNMAGPFNYGGIYDFNDDYERAEVIVDIIVQLQPDIITTNELYYGYDGNRMYSTIMGSLKDYGYLLVGDEDLNGGSATEYTSKDATTTYEKLTTGHTSYDETKDAPLVGSCVKDRVSMPENILYKKDTITFKNSSWSYIQEYESKSVSPSNPLGRVYYHGYHTALFEKDGQAFVVSVGHYGDTRTDDVHANNHYQSIYNFREKNGLDKTVPTIVTGDMYTDKRSTGENAGYLVWDTDSKTVNGTTVTEAFSDAQVSADVNANGNPSHGTCHDQGIRQTGRSALDFVWYNDGLSALCFKVLVSMDIDDCSDHYPVMADLKFN